MRLYHFTTEKYGLESIRDRHLKIARISELNDPFEFLGLNLDRRNRLALDGWRNEMDARFGLICMSTNWQHPLLWGHYADKHKGMALGFDVVENELFAEVKYDAKRPTLAGLGRTSLKDFGENDMKTLLLYKKFEAWSYESEYRAFCELDEKDPRTGNYFLPFQESMKLAQVIVGARCSVTRSDLNSALGDLAPGVHTLKARPAFTEFLVVENRRRSAWK